jgi:hypothetical protein
MTSTLAINIGITGHRDIPKQDSAKLESALIEELSKLKKQYSYSTINVLSGLAEGADQLMVKVALKLKLPVIAVLPFEVPEYEKDFDSEASLAEFRYLLSLCSEVKICEIDAKLPREHGYIELGRTLVNCSDIIIALWDGLSEQNNESNISTTRPGGTADVVYMCVNGLIDETSLLFSKPNKTYCKWLLTNRLQHQQLPPTISSLDKIATWQEIMFEGKQDEPFLNEILHKTERFNKEALHIDDSDIRTSADYLLGSIQNELDLTPIAKLVDAYCVADCLAQAKQKQRLVSLRSITTLSFFAIASQQIYVGLYTTIEWFLIHMLLVGLVIVIYRLFFMGTDSREEQFVEWRVFAEDLRVQIFWHIAGLPDHSAHNYRTTKLYEMDWIVDNLNKLMMHIPDPQSANIELVRKEWIIDQRNYFYGQRGERGRAAALMRKSKRIQRFSLAFFGIAILLMVLSRVGIHYGLWAVFKSPVRFVVIAMAFITSALLKTYAVQMGYEELSQRYLRTGYFFSQAMNRMALLDKNQADDIEMYQKVIKTIGIEALNENAAWLQLHKMNAYQVQVS